MQSQGTVISIGNHKGGVGKTTTTINLSAALARLKKGQEEKYKVLVIDMDPQSNATLTLFPQSQNVDYRKSLTIIDVFKGTPALETIINTNTKNLDIVPSNIEMFNLESTIINTTRSVEGLRAMLRDNVIKGIYDFILIDCPPNLGTFMINSFVASDYYIIPVESESYYALQGLNTLQERINEITSVSNQNLKLLGYLITRYDGRTSSSKTMVEAIRSAFGEKVFKTIIRNNTDINKASTMKKTIFQHDLRVNGAIDYTNLAKEIIKKLSVEQKLNEDLSTFN